MISLRRLMTIKTDDEKILVFPLLFLSLVLNCIPLVDSNKTIGDKGVCIKCEKNMDGTTPGNDTIAYSFGSCDIPSRYDPTIDNGYELTDTEYEECSLCYSQTRGPLVKRGCAPAPSPPGTEVQCVKDYIVITYVKNDTSHIMTCTCDPGQDKHMCNQNSIEEHDPRQVKPTTTTIDPDAGALNLQPFMILTVSSGFVSSSVLEYFLINK